MVDTELLLLQNGSEWRQAGMASSERGVEEGRGYSATTTTATTRGAAQIYCATLGEHKLEAGEHVGQLT
ncbi:hypothetical protein E2F47_19555 [Mycobacterium eburneum]|nr:hypothetical protein E2F47_19555 [Mycobacterium eburneum]